MSVLFNCLIIFPIEMFYRPLVQVIDISERPFPRFSGLAVSGPARLSSKMGSAKDSLDLVWGLHCRMVILRSHPPVVDIVLQVLATNELLYLIFKGNALLNVMVDISVESAVLVLVPLGAISSQRVRPLKNS